MIEAFCGRAGFLDWFSFAAGLVVGILLFAFVEAVVTLRWILVPSFQRWTGEELPSKPKGLSVQDPLMQDRVERLETEVADLTEEVELLSSGLSALREHVTRLERGGKSGTSRPVL